MHPYLVSLSLSHTLLSPFALSFCINTAGSSFIKTGVQIGHSCSHTPFCRCLIVAGLPRSVLTEQAAQQGLSVSLVLVALTSVWLYFQLVDDADTDSHGLK